LPGIGLSIRTASFGVEPRTGPIAAHVAFYPGGNLGAIAERGAYAGSPVLMLLGEKDDNLPLAKFENYLAYARAAGNPAPIEAVRAQSIADAVRFLQKNLQP
jgi:dienelactone hydrolase